jgi:hypothetical protein
MTASRIKINEKKGLIILILFTVLTIHSITTQASTLPVKKALQFGVRINEKATAHKII